MGLLGSPDSSKQLYSQKLHYFAQKRTLVAPEGLNRIICTSHSAGRTHQSLFNFLLILCSCIYPLKTCPQCSRNHNASNARIFVQHKRCQSEALSTCLLCLRPFPMLKRDEVDGEREDRPPQVSANQHITGKESVGSISYVGYVSVQ